MRLFNGRLVRKTLAFSKDVGMYRASAAWEDLVYNLAQPPVDTTFTRYGVWTDRSYLDC
jgi:hypothetical protein